MHSIIGLHGTPKSIGYLIGILHGRPIYTNRVQIFSLRPESSDSPSICQLIPSCQSLRLVDKAPNRATIWYLISHRTVPKHQIGTGPKLPYTTPYRGAWCGHDARVRSGCKADTGRMQANAQFTCNNTARRFGNSEKYPNKHSITHKRVNIIRESTFSASSRNLCVKACIISKVEALKHQRINETSIHHGVTVVRASEITLHRAADALHHTGTIDVHRWCIVGCKWCGPLLGALLVDYVIMEKVSAFRWRHVEAFESAEIEANLG